MQRSLARPARSRSLSRSKPEVFYGYCHRIQSMRMMNIDDYLGSLRNSYDQMRAYTDMLYRTPAPRGGCDCGCGPDCGCGTACDCGCDSACHDSCCDCCVCDADVLIQARCSERRVVSLTFVNDTRRDRDVTLSLSPFTTAGGRALNWAAALSHTQFQLTPCEERVVQLVVNVDCGAFGDHEPRDDNTGATGTTASDNRQDRRDLDRCEVAYARVSADGCLSRPVLVAVAVLPDRCDSHVSGCKCGCC
ncbi:MAG: hypothetical protein OIF47_03385 [Marinibacterium sp.]|nr:hypothetical protein [Marinibacterium sp.]